MHFFIAERVTLHLEQEIPNEIDTHPFKVWVLTFFHSPLLSKPWLVVLVVKTHNLVVVAVFLLSVLLITYFEILLPSPQPLSVLDVCHWHQRVSQKSSARNAVEERKRPSSFSVLFWEVSSQKPVLPSFLHLLLILFQESLLKPSWAKGVQCFRVQLTMQLTTALTSRSLPQAVSSLHPASDTPSTRGCTGWAQRLLHETWTSFSPCRQVLSKLVSNEWNHSTGQTRESGVGCQKVPYARSSHSVSNHYWVFPLCYILFETLTEKDD